MIRVGLTGGCCTGKSTVAEMFSRLGAEVISADQIVHRLLRDDPQVKSAVASLFGAEILAADGSLDRNKLAALVFDDRESLNRLTRVLYPKVRNEIGQFFDRANREGTCDICLAEVPLLIEGGALHLYDAIVVVKASYQNQLKRFLQKGGKTQADLDKRINNQMNLAEKVKVADYVVDNDGSVEETFEQVRNIYDNLRLRKGDLLNTPSTVTADPAVKSTTKRNKSKK